MKLLVMIIFISPSVMAETHKAHVHGLAKLALAIESPTTGNIDLDVAGDSIIGFEHPATSPKDKKTLADSLEKLRANPTSIIKFDPALKCIVSVKDVGLEKGAGQHSDVNASYSVKCDKPFAGSKVKVGLIGLFPRVKAVNLEILTTSAQAQHNVKSENESIVIP